jgi:hypothetical protein
MSISEAVPHLGLRRALSMLLSVLVAGVPIGCCDHLKATPETSPTQVPPPSPPIPALGPDTIVWLPGMEYVRADAAAAALHAYSLRLLEMIGGAVNRAVDVPEVHVDVTVDIRNRELFGYYVSLRESGEPATIVLGLRSLLILAHVAQAMAIADTIDRADRGEWLTMYLLLLRSNEWEQVPEPDVLWGSTLGESRLHAIAASSYFEQFLAFILAHELGHVVLGHDTEQPQSDSESRLREELADQFAIRTLMLDEQIQSELGFAGGLIFFMVSLQLDGASLAKRSTHPSDPERVLAYCEYLRRLPLPAILPEETQSAMRARAESLSANAKIALTQEDVVIRLDAASRRVKTEHLSRDRFLADGAVPLH